MSKHEEHFETFSGQTRLKHAILYAYLQRWAFKILSWGKAGNEVVYVDGFAGAGRDSQGNPGSPVIAGKIAIQVRSHFQKKGRLGQLRIMAVEANQRTFEQLSQQMAPFKEMDPAGVSVLCGSMTTHVQGIVSAIGSRPALYFLDPFGVGGLDSSDYPRMLGGPNNEILALFADVAAARHRGVVHAAVKAERELKDLQPSLFPELDKTRQAELKASIDKKQSVVKRFGDIPREIVSRAIGETAWVEELKELSAEDARYQLIKRFMACLQRSGARVVHMFPLRNAGGQHKYCLVHASKSLKGYTAMKETVSESLNQEGMTEIMATRIKDDLRVPMDALVAFVKQKFSGMSVRWSGDDPESVRAVLLIETEIFPFQYEELKQTLRKLVWLQRIDAKEFVTVPAD